ncbi:hypothetical protein B4U80_12642, partial [Leptotrombidium deliense]
MTAEIWLGKNVLDDQRITMVLEGNTATFTRKEIVGGLLDINTEIQQAYSIPEKPKVFKVKEAVESVSDEMWPKAPTNAKVNDPILETELNIGKCVTPEEKTEILDICNNHRKAFAKSINEIGCHPTEKMKIELTSPEVVNEKRIPLSYSERHTIDDVIKELESAGIVEKSGS